MRYVNFDIGDPESIEQAQQQLKDHVEAIERGEEMLTPIQFTEMLFSRRDRTVFAILA